MRVVEVTELGEPEVLQVAERPDPEPGPGQVVVRVRAANVNPTDLGARQGLGRHTPPDPPFVLGWDLAGKVTSVGEGVTDLSEGERVVGMVQWYDQRGSVGTYAEAVSFDADWLVPLPDGLDYGTAATIPLNAVTAHQGLELLDPPEGCDLLVTGASGGVGSFAVQLAKAAGHRVIAQAGRDDEDWPRELGAEEVLPRDAEIAGIDSVPAIFDAVPLGERGLLRRRGWGCDRQHPQTPRGATGAEDPPGVLPHPPRSRDAGEPGRRGRGGEAPHQDRPHPAARRGGRGTQAGRGGRAARQGRTDPMS